MTCPRCDSPLTVVRVGVSDEGPQYRWLCAECERAADEDRVRDAVVEAAKRREREGRKS